MITATLPAQPLPLTARPAIPRWRYLYSVVAVLSFLAILLLVHNETTGTRPLGITVERAAAGEPWTVATVTFTSEAANAHASKGDIVRMLDGRPITSATELDQLQVDQASQIVLERPRTDEVITIGMLGRNSQSLHLQAYLLLGISFFIVGLFASLLGRGAAPQALALLCYVGALEALVLPLGFNQIHWAILVNGLGVPLFMGSFAYLFLVFPTSAGSNSGRTPYRRRWCSSQRR